MFPFKLPMVLDGATGTALMEQGLSAEECAEQYILAHPKHLKELQRGYVSAGADCLYAPTFTTNEVFLAGHGLSEQTETITGQLVSLCKESANANTLIGGDMTDILIRKENISPTDFLDAVELYARQAAYLKQAGVDFIAIETMCSLTACRAAVLGAVKTGLPIFVTVYADFDDGGSSAQDIHTPSGDNLLAILITLQGMGIAAFGINCHVPESSRDIIALLYPYATVPLVAKPAAGIPPYDGASPQHFAHCVEQALNVGAQIVGGCCGTGKEHIAALRKLVDSFDFSSVKLSKESETVIAADATQLYFLHDNMILSSPLSCSIDMSDDILEAENCGADVLLILIHSYEDACNFAENAYMSTLPVCFSASSAEALNTALSLYQGRAIVDSQCDIDPKKLKELSLYYHAILY